MSPQEDAELYILQYLLVLARNEAGKLEPEGPLFQLLDAAELIPRLIAQGEHARLRRHFKGMGDLPGCGHLVENLDGGPGAGNW